MTYIQNVTDETVEHIASHCHNLEYVCLSNCKEVTDRALQALAIGCVNLRYETDEYGSHCLDIAEISSLLRAPT